MVELKLKCVTCSASFASDEIYSAHRQGHKKAEEWLRENLPKTKSTKRTPSPVKTVIEEPPPMSLIPHESQASVLRRAAKKPTALNRRSAPIIPNSHWRQKRTKENMLITRSPNLGRPAVKHTVKRLEATPAPEGEEDFHARLMVTTNKRKAEMRLDKGLPALSPYYCRNFMHKDCFFSSIYWASMRRHYESKHPETPLCLPPLKMRHSCECGKTFLEPNRLQEHMRSQKHNYQPNPSYQNPNANNDEKDDVTHWQDLVDMDEL